MIAKEASNTQSSLCWDGGDDVPQFRLNFGRKGGYHGSVKQNSFYIL